MTKRITIEKVQFASSPSTASETLQNGIQYCQELESGNILFFPKIPFSFPQEDIDFFLKQKQKAHKNRKNISYKPKKDILSNVVVDSQEDAKKLHELMRKFSNNATQFLGKLLSPYSNSWRLDYASFRPFQEEGRKLRTTARNDLLHIDAFPSRPLHGMRILRFFVNINPNEPRKWATSHPFEVLARNFLATKEVREPLSIHSIKRKLITLIKRGIQWIGLPMTFRSPYDEFMLALHHCMKQNKHFQEETPKDFWEFPSFSCWAVFTDQVSHAALHGQYALEQTFLVPKNVLLNPEKAPVSQLEQLVKKTMIDSDALKRTLEKISL